MNILHITNHLNTGGIASYVLTLGRGLKQRGHNVYVASSGGGLLGRITAEGITYIPIPIKTKREIGPKIFISMLKLSGIIKKHDIQLLHSHSRTTQVLGCLLHKFTGVPYVSTCHGFFKKRILRRLFPCWGERVIAISAQVKEHLIHDFGVQERGIRVIHNGIDADRFSSKFIVRSSERKKVLGLGSGPVIGIIARLSDVKGHKFLIQAMPEVLNKIPDAQLLIVGDGKMKEELVNLVKNLGIGKNVFFIPEVSDTRNALAAMDVFVMPSLKEGLGLALMEAMASSLAVVGSDVGGIKTLIRHGENGLLVEPQDTGGLAKAILELLTDKNKALQLGEAARTFITQNFSQGKMAQETERVYLECVS